VVIVIGAFGGFFAGQMAAPVVEKTVTETPMPHTIETTVHETEEIAVTVTITATETKTVLGHETAETITDTGTTIEEYAESFNELNLLEDEIDILIEAGNLISIDHYQRLKERLIALEGTIANEDIERVKKKLSTIKELVPEFATTATTQETTTTSILPEDYVPAAPDPEFDNFTWTLPTGASPLRLSLPADIDDFLFDENGGIGGYGLHAGGHIEGLDHVWIELKPGTPVRSWADGVVTDVRLSGDIEEGEYHITIDYGYNLVGTHMEIMTPYVEVGDYVSRGQEVGMGMSFNPQQSSAEFSLVDRGMTDGLPAWDGGVSVSPFDYLRDSDKRALVEAYKKNVIAP